MALADPQSITLAAAISLPRIQTSGLASEYVSADGTANLQVSHRVVRGRRQSLVRVSRKKVSTDVLTDTKSEIEAIVNFTINRPAVGFTETELIELVTGVSGWLTASTNANAKRVLGLES